MTSASRQPKVYSAAGLHSVTRPSGSKAKRASGEVRMSARRDSGAFWSATWARDRSVMSRTMPVKKASVPTFRVARENSRGNSPPSAARPWSSITFPRIRGSPPERSCSNSHWCVSRQRSGISAVIAGITQRKRAEERLRLQSVALESAVNTVLITDRDGRIAWVNPAFTCLTGYTAEEVLGQNPRLLKSGYHDQAFYRDLWETILSGQVWQREMTNRRKDGSLITEEQTITPVRDERGDITHFVSINHDITERRRAQETLHALYRGSLQIQERLGTKERLDHLIHVARELLHLDRVNILLADPSEQWLQALASSETGEPPETIRVPIQSGGGALAHAYLSRQTVVWDGAGPVPEAFRLAPPYDRIAALRSRVFAIVPLVVQGRAIGVLGVDRKTVRTPIDPATLKLLQLLAAQAAIAIENARLFEQVVRAKAEWEQTFDSISDLVALVDPEDRLVRVNRALAARLQTTPEALVGQPWYAVLHGRNAPSPGCRNAQTLLAELPITQEVEERHLGGTFLVTTSPFRNAEGQVLGSVHIARDITELKRLEEEARQRERFEDLSRAKSAFVATMSHELRTPLNSIIGFAELLRDERSGPLTEKQGRYLGHIHQSGRHLVALIGDILDLSKIEAGKIILEPQPLSVAAALEDVLVLARGLATKKGQEIHAEMAAELPPLQADPVRIKQITFNLLSNAVKFTPNGGRVTVTARRVDWSSSQIVDSSGPIDRLTARPIDATGKWLELAIGDTGIGIRAEDLPRLFQEFVQLETTQAQKHEGTGLGLAVTKKLVELHGGRIWGESEGEGRGSTFTVLLPFEGSGETSETTRGATPS